MDFIFYPLNAAHMEYLPQGNSKVLSDVCPDREKVRCILCQAPIGTINIDIRVK